MFFWSHSVSEPISQTRAQYKAYVVCVSHISDKPGVNSSGNMSPNSINDTISISKSPTPDTSFSTTAYVVLSINCDIERQFMSSIRMACDRQLLRSRAQHYLHVILIKCKGVFINVVHCHDLATNR